MANRTTVRGVVIAFPILAGILIGMLLHRALRNPVLHDPGARKYALWREGLNLSFPKQQINGFLEEDIDRDSLVRGLTLSQVQQKFDDVRTQERWTPYQAWCLSHYPPPPGTQSVFLGTDWWGVRFKDGRAIGFFLIKGC
ncbi:MAG TPA: hypothetical protein VMD97_00610 [Candidatus Aquilonibacter sp.]|nr:hypothetical protein [Candidatus Aquilonibacter sp.]